MLEEWLETAVIGSSGGWGDEELSIQAEGAECSPSHWDPGSARRGVCNLLAQLLKFVWSSLSSSVVPKTGTRTQHPRLARACPLSLGTLLI